MRRGPGSSRASERPRPAGDRRPAVSPRRASDPSNPDGLPAAPSLAAAMRLIHADVRRSFPALERDLSGGPRVYLNSGGGTLVAEQSVRAMERAQRLANAQDGDLTAGERATAAIHARARELAADFLNAPSSGEISFHLSTTHALFNLAFSFRDLLRPGDNLVVTRLDHAANVTPWESVWGEDRGLEIRECRIRPDGTLDLDHLRALVDRRTRVVAVTAASNGLGTIVPIRETAEIAHRFGRPDPPGRRRRFEGALLVVDAVHHAYHGPIDVRHLRCDFLAFSGYKLFGPMLGVLWGRQGWLSALRPYRVEANLDRPPYKFEQGTPNHAVLAGLTGALDYLLWLGGRAEAEGAAAPGLSEAIARRYPPGPRRLLKWALCAIREYEKELSATILERFGGLASAGVRLHGLADPARAGERDPTFLFEIDGLSQKAIKRRLWEEGRIEVPSGTCYSLAIYRTLARRRRHVVRASFAHYDNAETGRLFLDGVARIARG
jgi:cysteine desulfurase family protein (TIGR01976 family)